MITSLLITPGSIPLLSYSQKINIITLSDFYIDMNEYKLDKAVLILIFCISIFTPFLLGFIQEDKISSGIEKRNLATLPLLPNSIKEFTEYPKNINSYYSDHFGLREVFTKLYFKLINKLDSQSSLDDVTIGQDDWLFLGSIKRGYQGYDDPIGDAMNINLYTEKELKEFATSLVTIKNWLSNKGIEYIYVIAPNKHTIYFEKLPEFIVKKNNKSSTDQLIEYLQEHTDVNVVDLRPALLKAKKKQQVYFKTDSHWNHYGANVAQFEILKKIELLFPKQIKPILLVPNQFKTIPAAGGDLAGFAKIENLKEDKPLPIFATGCTPVNEIQGVNEREIYTTTCKTQELNAIIFKDSYFIALQPYFSRQFHHTTYIEEKINYPSLVKYIEKNKPDIVIEEVIERELPYIPSADYF